MRIMVVITIALLQIKSLYSIEIRFELLKVIAFLFRTRQYRRVIRAYLFNRLNKPKICLRISLILSRIKRQIAIRKFLRSPIKNNKPKGMKI